MEPQEDPPAIKEQPSTGTPGPQQKSPPSIKRSCAMPTAVNTASPERKSPSENTPVVTPPKALAADPASAVGEPSPGASQQSNTTPPSSVGGASYAPNFIPPDAVNLPAASKGKRAIAPGVAPTASTGGAQRSQSKRMKPSPSKRPPIDTLNLSSPVFVRDLFVELKGADEPIPDDLLSALKSILTVYTISELSQFSIEKTRVEWPKGAKSVGVHKLAEFFFHELECLHSAEGNTLPIVWPPPKISPLSKTESVDGNPTHDNSRGSNKTAGITLSDVLFEGVGTDLADVQKLIQSYALCLDQTSNEKPAALLVAKKSGEYFTLVASDPLSAVTAITIKPDNDIHKAWKLFTSEDDLRTYIISKTNEYEAIMSSGGNFASDKSRELLGQMNRDKSSLHVFTQKVVLAISGNIGNTENSLLVGLQYDGSVKLLKAQDKTSLSELAAFHSDNSVYHCWKLFDDITLAEQFVLNLRNADMKAHLPPDPTKISAERNAVLSELDDTPGILSDFVLTASAHTVPSNNPVESFLVVLFRNYATCVLAASNPDSTMHGIKIIDEKSDAFGWKVFATLESAESFQLRLKALDSSTPLPESPKSLDGPPLTALSVFRSGASGLPPQTRFTEEQERENCKQIGNMMAREDTYAECLAAEAGADANEAEAKAHAAGAKAHAAGATHSKIFTTGSTGLNRNSNSLRFSPPGKSTGGGCLSAEASGSEVLDMSKMKFNFNKDGRRAFDQGVKLLVSSLIPHKFYNEKYAFCLMSQIHRQLWFFEAAFLQELTQPYVKSELVAKGKSVPLFLETLDDIALCKPNSPHEYRTSKSGWTINKPCFIVRVPNGMASVDKYVSDAFNTIASNFKENSSIGAFYADWLRTNKENLYNSETGITGKKKKITHEQFAQFLQTKLVQAFSSMNTEFNVPLDKMITYGHIKQMLIEQCGYNHWSELPLELKSAILARTHQAYPDWDQTEIKAYGFND